MIVPTSGPASHATPAPGTSWTGPAARYEPIRAGCEETDPGRKRRLAGPEPGRPAAGPPPRGDEKTMTSTEGVTGGVGACGCDSPPAMAATVPRPARNMASEPARKYRAARCSGLAGPRPGKPPTG